MASSARIDELRKKFDENPRRYFAPLANEYRKAGDLEQAIFICQEYLPQQPGHMSGHIVYGQALFELNRHEEAKAVFETALSLDPENLIALRHLGDIAHHAGDVNGARAWYQRVLEADPRNEEIAQLVGSLQTSEAPVSEANAVDHSAPTPLNTPAVSAQTAEATPSEAPAAEASLEVEKAPDTTLDVAPPTPEEPVPGISRHAPKEEELLDLDSFDLGGVPLSSLRESSEAEPEAAATTEPELASAQPDVDGMFDLPVAIGMPEAASEEPVLEEQPAEPRPEEGQEDGEFEADPFAIAAVPQAEREAQAAAELQQVPEPEVEQATDIELGLPDDSAPVAGLETFESGVLPSTPPEALAIETDSFFSAPPTPLATSVVPDIPLDVPLDIPPVAPSVEEAVEPEAVAEKTEVFVTETMATLYLQQGHLESALDIYRKLVDQRPDDAGLRERLEAVEAQVRGVPPTAVTPPEQVEEDIDEAFAPAPHSYGGPTIREFLSGIVSRRGSAQEESVEGPEATEASEASEASEATEWTEEAQSETTVEAVVEEMVPETTEEELEQPVAGSRPTPSSSETVSGSLGALFSGADAASSDNDAAQALSEAFAPDSPENAPLHGVPAHRASKELSLNHVFKSVTPTRPTPEAEDFSFDQFFEQNSEEGSVPTTDTPADGTPEATDDIAQFNAWLNGLKKT